MATPIGVPGAEPRSDVSEDVGGQLASGKAGRPDLTLQGLERGGLEVGIHPGVQHGDDVGSRRAGCELRVGDRRGDGRGHLLVAGVGLDPRLEPGPGVVVEADVDRGSRTRGALDVDDDRPGRHAKYLPTSAGSNAPRSVTILVTNSGGVASKAG